jgi:hypothetical protein
MRLVVVAAMVGFLSGSTLCAAAQEKGSPAPLAPPPDEVGVDVKRRLERMEQVRGAKKEVRISPTNVEIRIRPPDADPSVDFSYAVVSLTLKKPVQGVREITYWAYSLADAITLGDIFSRSAGVEVTVRCPPKGDTSRCWFESFIFR